MTPDSFRTTSDIEISRTRFAIREHPLIDLKDYGDKSPIDPFRGVGQLTPIRVLQSLLLTVEDTTVRFRGETPQCQFFSRRHNRLEQFC